MRPRFIFVALFTLCLVGCSKDKPSPKSGGTDVVEFSVSPTKRVRFSSGNLQYQPSTDKWRFAPNQWDCIGEANANIENPSYSGWLDLFGWGTGNNPTNYSTEYRDYSDFVDWGRNMGSGWRTLSYEEWKYLFYSRTNAANLRGQATVNEVHGYVLLPDGWSEGGFKPNPQNWYSNTFTSEQWQQLEQSGAVFLPCAGRRYGTKVNDVGSWGIYWSSVSYDISSAYYFYFGSGYASPNDWFTRYYGRSVRLIKDL